MPNRCVAVLGRADSPTDAVEDYCRYLAAALTAHDTSLAVARVPWLEAGWGAALTEFSAKFPSRENSWFLLQYTSLAWSQRGFSWRFAKVIRHLKKNGARCAVVFHDTESYLGSRPVDRIRRVVQIHAMRQAVRLADLSIFTIPLNKISWIAAPPQETAFIPVGANLPAPEQAWQVAELGRESTLAVAIFALTGGNAGIEEIKLIADAASFAAERVGPIRIVVFGRNSELAGTYLKQKLGAAPVQVNVHGLLPAEQLVHLLISCDVMLSVRGPISTRRGSAMAGIACGLPVIASQGWETAAPLTEAGVVLVPLEEPNSIGSALVRVLSDATFRAHLAKRSRDAYLKYFSWDVIASQFVEAMQKCGPKP